MLHVTVGGWLIWRLLHSPVRVWQYAWELAVRWVDPLLPCKIACELCLYLCLLWIQHCWNTLLSTCIVCLSWHPNATVVEATTILRRGGSLQLSDLRNLKLPVLKGAADET